MTVRARVAATAAVLAAVGAPASAGAEVHLGGHLKSFIFQELSDPYHFDRAGSRLQLELRGRTGEVVSFFAAVDFELDSRLLTADQPASRGEGLDVYPVEAYLDLTTGPLEIRVGQQFVFWGRTTWENPTDIITPWNYPDMASEVEDYRLAPFAARLNWYLVDELMLDVVWAPWFRPDRIGPLGLDEVGGLPVIEGPSGLPSRRIDHGELGVRLSHAISEWAFDWSISAYKGFEKLPVMVFEPHLSDAPGAPPVPDALVLTRRYDPLWMVGLDFAKAVDAFVFKGEAALLVGDDGGGDDPGIRNSRVEAVAGVDYVVSDDLELGVQYIGRFLLDYDEDAERATLTQLSGAPPDYVDPASAHAASLFARWSFTDELGGQLTGIYNVTHQDFFVFGFLSWEIADATRLNAGAVGFGGADDATPYGRQASNSRMFAELTHAF